MSGRDSHTPGKEGAKSLGVARAAYEEGIPYAKQRVQGGKPIIEHQAVATVFADMAMDIEAARSLTWRAAWAVDHDPEQAEVLEEMAQVFCAEVAVRAALRAMEACGGNGILRENPMEKLLRDASSMLHAGCGNHAVRVRLAGLLAAKEQPFAAISGNGRVERLKAPADG